MGTLPPAKRSLTHLHSFLPPHPLLLPRGKENQPHLTTLTTFHSGTHQLPAAKPHAMQQLQPHLAPKNRSSHLTSPPPLPKHPHQSFKPALPPLAHTLPALPAHPPTSLPSTIIALTPLPLRPQHSTSLARPLLPNPGALSFQPLLSPSHPPPALGILPFPSPRAHLHNPHLASLSLPFLP